MNELTFLECIIIVPVQLLAERVRVELFQRRSRVALAMIMLRLECGVQVLELQTPASALDIDIDDIHRIFSPQLCQLPSIS